MVERVTVWRYLRLVTAYTATGLIVGLVWFGIGGRLLMRVLALTSSEAVQGAFTDAGEEIGVVSFSGTVALLVFGALPFGLLGAGVYGLLRPLLPERSTPRLGTCAVVGGVVALFGVVDVEGRDFSLLEPSWLAVALLLALGAGGGVALSLVAERLRPFYLEAPTSFPRVLAFLPLVVVAIPVVAIPVVILGIAYLVIMRIARPSWLLSTMRFAVTAIVALAAVMGIVRLGDIEVRPPRSSDFVDPFPE